MPTPEPVPDLVQRVPGGASPCRGGVDDGADGVSPTPCRCRPAGAASSARSPDLGLQAARDAASTGPAARVDDHVPDLAAVAALAAERAARRR